MVKTYLTEKELAHKNKLRERLQKAREKQNIKCNETVKPFNKG